MLVSLEWLKDLVDISGIDPEKIAHELTMSGLEVEEIEYIKPKFSKVYTARIEAIRQHPNADKIQLPTVDYGFGKQEVVCGAQNIAVGQIIAFAVEGATVYNRKDNQEFTLKKAKIRGIESSGMICSASELCLEGKEYDKFSHGIIVLSEMDQFKGKEIKLGTPLEELIQIRRDIILHTAPTANRGDLLSMRGVANEVSAIFNLPAKKQTVDLSVLGLNNQENFEVSIKDSDTCKYYSIGIVKDVKIKNSPDWMVQRLESSGMRPINNIVDITNYVMLEYGQPLHAFDLDKLNQTSLCVRRANDNEEIVTLDNVKRQLTNDSVLIATPTEPVGLAGLMGGFSSEVDENTKHLALESAYFTPSTNRKSARSVGLRTEASARFERGVDIHSVKVALKRAMDLMVELADAKIAGFYETGKDELDQTPINLRFNQINRILGINVPKEKALEILKNLDFKIVERNEVEAKVLVPSYRICDVNREIDLIEEISRIYGYDKVPESLPRRTQISKLPDNEKLNNLIKNILLGNGFNEVITSSLTGYPLLNWCDIPIKEDLVIKVTNPQSDEYTMLRHSMIPSMLQILKYNIDRDIKDLNLFEIGKTYFIDGQTSNFEPGVKENIMLCGAVTGNIQHGKWHSTFKSDYYYIKGILESLFEAFNISKRIEFFPTNEISFMHPGRTAYVDILGKPKEFSEKKLGFVGQLNPKLASCCKFGQEVYVFELDLNILLACLSKSVPYYKAVPQFPSVLRDIAFLIDIDINSSDILKTIRKSGSSLLKDVELFDLYTGSNIPDNFKSIAIRLTIQDVNATLTDSIVDREVENVKNSLQKVYNVTFR